MYIFIHRSGRNKKNKLAGPKNRKGIVKNKKTKQICLEETAVVKIRGVSPEGVIDELTASVYCRMQHHRNTVIGLLLTNSVLQPLKQCSSDIEVASLEVTPMNPTRKPAVNYNKQRPS